MAIERIRFSIDRHDRDGCIYERGVYLEIGPVSIKVCDTPAEFSMVINNLRNIQKEIEENYIGNVTMDSTGQTSTTPAPSGDQEQPR